MPRPLFVLLILVPLSAIGEALGFSPTLLFFISLCAVAPLAGIIAEATSQAALAKGPKVGGMLNATFGNIPDLLVGYFGVQAGLLALVKATLMGAIISNTALIIGLSFFTAGARHGFARFNAREAGSHSALMLLAVAGLLLPSIAAATVQPPPPTEELSILFAIILILAYVAYVVFSVFGFIGPKDATCDLRLEGDVIATQAAILEETRRRWPFWLSVTALLAAALALIPVTDVLIASVSPTIEAFGWTHAFVGVIFVANAGNAAEMYSAVTMGARNRLNLSMEVASGSSIQIATLIAPLVVFLSLRSHPMDLVFNPLELGILFVVVAIFVHVAHDGETNWLEGFQLIAIYAMAAAVFYVVPTI